MLLTLVAPNSTSTTTGAHTIRNSGGPQRRVSFIPGFPTPFEVVVRTVDYVGDHLVGHAESRWAPPQSGKVRNAHAPATAELQHDSDHHTEDHRCPLVVPDRHQFGLPGCGAVFSRT